MTGHTFHSQKYFVRLSTFVGQFLQKQPPHLKCSRYDPDHDVSITGLFSDQWSQYGQIFRFKLHKIEKKRWVTSTFYCAKCFPMIKNNYLAYF